MGRRFVANRAVLGSNWHRSMPARGFPANVCPSPNLIISCEGRRGGVAENRDGDIGFCFVGDKKIRKSRQRLWRSRRMRVPPLTSSLHFLDRNGLNVRIDIENAVLWRAMVRLVKLNEVRIMDRSASTRPATAREIILEIVRNMREGLEPLQYTTLPPSIYDV